MLKLEEKANGISHGIAAILSLIGLLILAYYGAIDERKWSLFSALIYGSSLLITFTASTLYHFNNNNKPKVTFRILDHASIFILIAGTYTPLLLLHIKGEWGFSIFFLQWGLTVIGILLKVFFTGKVDYLFVLMYLVMGWIIVFKIDFLATTLSTNALVLMVIGGLMYTLGIVFYIIDNRLKFAHLIWHLFVIAGSFAHFLFIALYIL
jgi:hemolysin III